MLAQLTDLQSVGLIGLPLASIAVGLGGSLHCLGMCGAFSTSCSRNTNHQIGYHGGRLLGYTSLGVLGGFIGHTFSKYLDSPLLKLFPGILMGIFFLAWGVSVYRNKSLILKLPSFLQRRVDLLLGMTYRLSVSSIRSLFLGFLSIFLPCGLLYGVVLTLASFQSPLHGAVGMFFFGIGTIPSLALGTNLIKTINGRFKILSNKYLSYSLISLGLITISYRIWTYYGQVNCH